MFIEVSCESSSPLTKSLLSKELGSKLANKLKHILMS